MLKAKQERNYLTPAEAGKILGYCAETIRRMVRCGQLKAYRIRPRGYFRIPVREIERICNRLQVKS